MQLSIDGQILRVNDHYRAGKFIVIFNYRIRKANVERQGVFDVDFTTGLTLIEIAEGVTVDEIQSKTEAPFRVADGIKRMM